ncbi:MAG: alanine racemase [Endozoicomonas sp.]|uniref:alanine racemase n=1 Tax=Endozoicomonas sp. TaxID=1892382 RepID=UPI003D9BB00F
MLTFALVILILFILVTLIVCRDRGAPHDRYFSTLETTLEQSGIARPMMLLDMDRVDHNIEVVRQRMGDTSNLRIVAKSLPCPGLLAYLQQKLETNRLMVFHQPFLNQLVRAFPDGDFLIGKPFPVAAATTFLDQLDEKEFNCLSQVQWLVDSYPRLEEYLALAQKRELKFRINVEINVGLNRGGLAEANELLPLLQLIQNNPDHLEFSGLMGYEAHLAKMPLSSIRQAGRKKALSTYSDFVAEIEQHFPEWLKKSLCFNGAGSMTYQLYPENDRGPINEISIGSAFVKPVDFDLDTLVEHQAALFIATPVLKKHRGLSLPFLSDFSQLASRLNKNLEHSFFIYGGWWKAQVCSPMGLKNNSFYGRSTNQELLTGSSSTGLEVDCSVFLRPTQSESVMLQFGQIKIMRGSQLSDQWQAFDQDY